MHDHTKHDHVKLQVEPLAVTTMHDHTKLQVEPLAVTTVTGNAYCRTNKTISHRDKIFISELLIITSDKNAQGFRLAMPPLPAAQIELEKE